MNNDIRMVVIDAPPVNAIGPAERCRLYREIDAGINDDAVSGLVLRGAGRFFSCGADIEEFDVGLDADAPDPNDLARLIETSPKPVVAVINGPALGGGFELALACHARVIAGSAIVGLPEVTLGVIPGAGGTQRLTRLVGYTDAIDLILNGRMISAARAVELGLAVGAGASNAEEAAIALARSFAGEGALYPTSRLALGLPGDDEKAEAEAWRRKAKAGIRGAFCRSLAVQSILNVGSLDFETALATERRFFEDCRTSEESRALRYQFFAERRAGKVAGLPAGMEAKEVRSVLVVGAGTMGSGIATAFLQSGYKVQLVDQAPATLASAREKVEANLRKRAKRQFDSEAQAQTWLAGFETLESFDETPPFDLVIEAVFEDFEIKRRVLRQLELRAPADAILASNTSALDLNRLAESLETPDRLIGMHFFSPAHVMKLLEIVRPDALRDDVLASVLKLSKRLGKTGVVSGVCPGFIANRILYTYLRQVDQMILEGASPRTIDDTLEAFGFAMGPCRMLDMAGQDIAYAVRQDQKDDLPMGFTYPEITDRLVEAGRLGVKVGKGWYRYEPGDRAAHDDPEVETLIRETAAQAGLARRDVSSDEIVERCLLRQINEGALILSEGIAQRPSDIDVCFCAGLGLSPYLGGPMYQADRMGLDLVLDRLERLQAQHGVEWAPAPLIRELAESGSNFASLNEEGT